MIWPGILLWSLSMLTGPEKFRPGIPGFAEFADANVGIFDQTRWYTTIFFLASNPITAMAAGVSLQLVSQPTQNV